MKRTSLLIVVVFAMFAAISLVGSVHAGDKCCIHNGKTVKASCAVQDCPKACQDKGKCKLTCESKDCKGSGQCSEACKATCPQKAAAEKKQCGTCKPGACGQTACKGAPGK